LHLAREAPWYMMRLAGQAQYRRSRLNSNVSPRAVCTQFDLWSMALFAAMVCAVAVAASLQHGFVTQLELRSPSLWAELGRRRIWADDGNTSYAAAQLFLLKGEHTTLADPGLVKLGSRARLAFFVSIGLFLAWFPVVIVSDSFLPRFSCFFAAQ
jgi:hypothetical protein